MSFRDRFFHHAARHRFTGLTGSPLEHSLPRRLFGGPDAKLCAAFGVVAAGVAAVFAPEKLPDVVAYASSAFVVTPLVSRIAETGVLANHARAFYPGKYNPKTNVQETQWHAPYVIDRTPDGKSSLPIPHRDIDQLTSKYQRMVRVLTITSALFAPIMALTMYRHGYWPNFLLAAPLLGGTIVKFIAAAERYERLKSGRYALVRLPVRPANGRSPAP